MNPQLKEFEDDLYIAKDRVLEVWQDWQNHPEDISDQLCAKRARSRCRAIIQEPGTWEEKVVKLAIAYTLSDLKCDRLYRILERPIKVTRYEPEGDEAICRYYWNDGQATLNGKGTGKDRICRAPIATLEILKEAIAAGDSDKMLEKIRQTGQREVMAWVPSFEQFIKEWLSEN